MKKQVLCALLCFLLVAFVSATSADLIVGTTGISSAVTYNDIIHFWTAETTGSPYWDAAKDCSDDDTTPTLISSAVVNSSAVKIGSNGLDNPASSDYVLFNDFHHTCGDLRYGFWLYATTWVDTTVILKLVSCTAAGDTEIRWRTGNELEIREAGTIKETTSGANITTGTWYFIEIVMDDTNDSRKIIVDGTTRATEVDAWTGQAMTEIHLGVASNDLADLYNDNLMVSDDVTRDFNSCCKNLTTKPSGACDG
jgi:hypothetical protein